MTLPNADPIFAAIERMKTAHAVLDTVVDEYSKLETLLPEDKRRSENQGGELFIAPDDDPHWIDNQRRYNAASDGIDERAADLLKVRPTTISGVIALLRYAQDDSCWPDNFADDLLGHVADALEAMAEG